MKKLDNSEDSESLDFEQAMYEDINEDILFLVDSYRDVLSPEQLFFMLSKTLSIACHHSFAYIGEAHEVLYRGTNEGAKEFYDSLVDGISETSNA